MTPLNTPAIEEGLFTTDPPALLIARCDACSALSFPDRGRCPACQGTCSTAIPAAGGGTLYTFTVVRARPPGYLGDAPYALGVVELDEGLRVGSAITAADLDLLAIGDRVEFELITLGAAEESVLSYAFRRAWEPIR